MDILLGAANLLYLSEKRVNASTAKRGYSEEKWVASYIENDFQVNNDRRSKVDLTNGRLNIQVKKSKAGQFQQISRGTVDNLVAVIPELQPIESLLKERCEQKQHFSPEYRHGPKDNMLFYIGNSIVVNVLDQLLQDI